MVLSPAEKTAGGSGGRWSAAKPFLRAPAARRTGRGSCAHRSSGWLGSDNQSRWKNAASAYKTITFGLNLVDFALCWWRSCPGGAALQPGGMEHKPRGFLLGVFVLW